VLYLRRAFLLVIGLLVRAQYNYFARYSLWLLGPLSKSFWFAGLGQRGSITLLLCLPVRLGTRANVHGLRDGFVDIRSSSNSLWPTRLGEKQSIILTFYSQRILLVRVVVGADGDWSWLWYSPSRRLRLTRLDQRDPITLSFHLLGIFHLFRARSITGTERVAYSKPYDVPLWCLVNLIFRVTD
jgi:hypothetical protein